MIRLYPLQILAKLALPSFDPQPSPRDSGVICRF
jgi:hypothetical protein